MNVLMLSNTYTPYVGGVARSVQSFADELRRKGHRVLVAAPQYKRTPKNEQGVIRFPAIQHFNGSDFSLPMPLPGRLGSALQRFRPDVVHSHHPFLLGGTALRVAAVRDIPLIFTHHTMYEKYTHYVPGDSLRLKRFVVDLVTGYCDACDAVIAPSETVAKLLRDRGVAKPLTVIPTGVDREFFGADDGPAFRKRLGIPPDAFVVGHVGRLASEKNLEFLTAAVIQFLEQHRQAHFLLVGIGPSKKQIRAAFESRGLTKRLRCAGLLGRRDVARAYTAMDAFAFASHTETQGMVLAEAMAAGVPVIAVEASGVREVVCDGCNGRLLRKDDVGEFASALWWSASLPAAQRHQVRESARSTAAEFKMTRTADRLVKLYESLISIKSSQKPWQSSALTTARRRIRANWQILHNLGHAAADSIWPAKGHLGKLGYFVKDNADTFRDEIIRENDFGPQVQATGMLRVGAVHTYIDGTHRKSSNAILRKKAHSNGPKHEVPPSDTRQSEPTVGEQAKPQCSAQILKAIAAGAEQRLRARFLGWLWACLLRLQCATWRKQYDGIERLDRMVKDGHKVLFSFWHGKYVPLFALLRGRSACVFTSRSARGDVLAEICRRFGYDCVQLPDWGRGYSLQLMRRALADHQAGGIAVDGPLGPYHSVKRGAIKLASELGYVVVPASVCARRKRVLEHRWDRMEVPSPFTRVGFAIGSPIEVPPGLSVERERSFVDRLNDALDCLDQRAAELARATE